jgi:pimeloyl-ACP methyl ester carboxylesterase
MSLQAALATFPLESAHTPLGVVQFRRAHAPGATGPVTHVLLHGIGSASASWLAQLQAARDGASGAHVVAWDAPGYGQSTPLAPAEPSAADYAVRARAWLDGLGDALAPHFTLVGHSLGALMAASLAAQDASRLERLVLLSPAGGYAKATAQERTQKLQSRLANLAERGPAGIAQSRAPAMLSPQATPEQIAYVQSVMAAIDPAGYTQAAHMLAGGDLVGDLQRVRCPLTVASGSADTITPPAGCRSIAQAAGAPYLDLGPAGHSCALEAADAVNRLLGLVS